MPTTVIHIKDVCKDWKSNPDYVYIGRPGKNETGYFGNPFKLGANESRGSSLDKFEAYFRNRLANDSEFKDKVHLLKNKILVCFCRPHPCHGDVIAKYLDSMDVLDKNINKELK